MMSVSDVTDVPLHKWGGAILIGTDHDTEELHGIPEIMKGSHRQYTFIPIPLSENSKRTLCSIDCCDDRGCKTQEFRAFGAN